MDISTLPPAAYAIGTALCLSTCFNRDAGKSLKRIARIGAAGLPTAFIGAQMMRSTSMPEHISIAVVNAGYIATVFGGLAVIGGTAVLTDLVRERRRALQSRAKHHYPGQSSDEHKPGQDF